jgi:protein LSM14
LKLIPTASYVGTLVEINSENSTVALENVMSYGTEDRRTGADSFPPSASLYDYILFRGSDVKDLRIEEPPKETSTPNPPTMPNDPAILGVRCHFPITIHKETL